ncbi:MAG: MerR family transcriptional regulator [Paludibacteraceae bacterium]
MENEKIYYSMREVCEQTGVTPATLRYWEKQFDDLSPRKDGHGNRYYTQQDIALVARIKYIRDELKITRIEAIRRELQTDKKQSSVKYSAVEILRNIRAELVELRGLINQETE